VTVDEMYLVFLGVLCPKRDVDQCFECLEKDCKFYFCTGSNNDMVKTQVCEVKLTLAPFIVEYSYGVW